MNILEPLKQLGINMSVANLEAYALSQGITTAYNSMTQAEQATLRYNYLMSVSADAQGDFARTSDSLANQLRVAKLQIDDIAASVGSVLLPIATQGITELNGLVQQLKAAFDEGGIQGLVAEAGNVVGTLAQKIVEAAPTLVQTAITLLQSLAQGIFDNLPIIISTVLPLLNTFIQTIMENQPILLQASLDIIMMLANGISQYLPELIPAAVDMILELAMTLVNNLEPLLNAALTLLIALSDGIINALPIFAEKMPEIVLTLVDTITSPEMFNKLLNAALDIVDKLVVTIIDNLPLFLDAGFKIIGAFVQGIFNSTVRVASAISTIISRYIISPLSSVVSSVFSVGSNIISGLWNGITSKYYWLKSKVTGVIDNIKGWFTGIFGFDTHSPSKWSEKVFKNVMEGMDVGAEKNKKYAKNAALTAVNTAKDTFEKNSILDNIKIGARNVSAMLGVPRYAFGVSGGGTVNNYTTYTDRAPIQVTSVAVLDGEVVYQNQQTVSANHGEKLSNRGW